MGLDVLMLRGYLEEFFGKEATPNKEPEEHKKWQLKNDLAFTELLIRRPSYIFFEIIGYCKAIYIPSHDTHIYDASTSLTI